MSANGDMSLDYKQACETVACLDYSALRGNMPCTSVVVHTRITANTIISSTVIFLKECRSRSVSRGFLRGGMLMQPLICASFPRRRIQTAYINESAVAGAQRARNDEVGLNRLRHIVSLSYSPPPICRSLSGLGWP